MRSEFGVIPVVEGKDAERLENNNSCRDIGKGTAIFGISLQKGLVLLYAICIQT